MDMHTYLRLFFCKAYCYSEKKQPKKNVLENIYILVHKCDCRRNGTLRSSQMVETHQKTVAGCGVDVSNLIASPYVAKMKNCKSYVRLRMKFAILKNF